MQTDIFSNVELATRDVYTVSRLNFEAASFLSGHFPLIWISGEVSNFAKYTSGHMYFSLKDAKSQVRCVMFKRQNQSLNFAPENGLQVLLRAKISLYESRGDFQLIIEQMEVEGEGRLRQQYETLKAKLQSDGYFDEQHKKPLPKMPKVIGVVTSSSGAVIHDITTTFKRRFPLTKIRLYPSMVQGDGAAENIVKMIHFANDEKVCDALIVGRGGGSLEDLWAFNEFVVAQAIYESQLPIVSAVGHESDVCIADWVADARAPTPSIAAEILSPDIHELNAILDGFSIDLGRKINHILKAKQSKLAQFSAMFSSPQNKINQLNIKLDEWQYRLQKNAKQATTDSSVRLLMTANKLQNYHPVKKFQSQKEQLVGLQQRLSVQTPNFNNYHNKLMMVSEHMDWLLQAKFRQIQMEIQSILVRLEATSPLKVLARGYAIVKNKDKQLIKNNESLKAGDKINITLHRVEINALVEKITVTNSQKKSSKI